MAEALLRLRFNDRYEAFSAGTSPSRVNPWAIRAMRELGVDISGQVSKHVQQYLDQPFDVVVTTCDTARQTCPAFPKARRSVHRSFGDPSLATGSDAQILGAFRHTRDEIDRWIQETFSPPTLRRAHGPETAPNKRGKR